MSFPESSLKELVTINLQPRFHIAGEVALAEDTGPPRV